MGASQPDFLPLVTEIGGGRAIFAGPESPTNKMIGVVVTQPASKSQQNVQREGFALLYARQLLVKATGA